MSYARAAALAAAFAMGHGAAAAQETATAPAPAAAAAAVCCTIPARTVLEIEILDAINSKDNRAGESFRFRLAEPLTMDGQVLIPAGTPGIGEIVHAARARMGGKAGELILAARFLELGDRRISLRTFRFGRSQGRDNSGTVNTIGMISAATIPAVGMVGYLIAGGEVRVAVGARATAQTSMELVLAPVQ